MKRSINKHYKDLWELPSFKSLIVYSALIFSLLVLILLLTELDKILSPLILFLSFPIGYIIIKSNKTITLKRFFGFFLFFNIGFLLSILFFKFFPFYPERLSLITLVYFMALGCIAFYYISDLKSSARIFLLNALALPYILSYSFIAVKNFSNVFFEVIKNYLIFFGVFWSLELYLLLVRLAIIRKYKIDLLEHFRAFLLSWLSKEKEYFEKILVKTKLSARKFKLNILTLRSDDKKLALFSLPIHPGPFLTVGSSDLPSLLMGKISLPLMPFHGFSTHKQDLVMSKDKHILVEMLEKKLLSVNEDKPLTCSRFHEVTTENFVIRGLMIDNVPLIVVNQKRPGVIDDIDSALDEKIKSLAKTKGFEDLILIDAHNAYSPETKESEEIETELLEGVKNLLAVLKEAKPEKVKWSFQKIRLSDIPELSNEACSGEGILLLLANENYMNCLILIDSNNIEYLLRNKVQEKLKEMGVECEICSTDSHSMTGKVTGNDGYYPFGNNKELHELVIRRIIEALEKAKKELKEGYVTKTSFLTPEFKVLGNLAEIYEKGSDFVKFGKLLPLTALLFSTIIVFFV